MDDLKLYFLINDCLLRIEIDEVETYDDFCD